MRTAMRTSRTSFAFAALLAASLPLALSVYAAFFVVGALATLFIGVETRGRELRDTAEA